MARLSVYLGGCMADVTRAALELATPCLRPRTTVRTTVLIRPEQTHNIAPGHAYVSQYDVLRYLLFRVEMHAFASSIRIRINSPYYVSPASCM